jgi:hypothetical protein
MSLVHLHLITNHVPVVGIFIGIFVLLWAQIRKSSEARSLALVLFVALGVVTLIAYFTGEPAEEAVENLAGVAKAAIEEHEDASVFGLFFGEVIALISLAGLSLRSLREKKWFVPLLIALSIFTSTVFARIAYLGGNIRHTEITEPN